MGMIELFWSRHMPKKSIRQKACGLRLTDRSPRGPIVPEGRAARHPPMTPTVEVGWGRYRKP
eukprot:scaffold213264_cov27-Tisochrysis_lutea.AAC.1